MRTRFERFQYGIRAIAAATVGFLVALVLMRATIPSGVFHVRSDFSRPSAFVSILKPADRVFGPDDPKGAPDVMTLDAAPVYVDLTPPSDFETVTMRVRYYRSADQPVMLGALASSLDGSFMMERDSDPFVDPLSVRGTTWAAPRRWTVSLRGSHRMATVTDGSALRFTFQMQDMNRAEGEDPVHVAVYPMGETDAPVATATLEDDGNGSDDQYSTGLRSVSVTVLAPRPAAYGIAVTTTDDVFIREIETDRPFVFTRRLALGDHIGYSDRVDPIAVQVRGTRLLARATGGEGRQELVADGVTLSVGDAHRTVGVALPDAWTTAVAPKRAVVLRTDGVFAFDADMRIGATMASFAPEEDATSHGYFEREYTAAFADLATTEEGAYRFVIDAPAYAFAGGALGIRSVEFRLERPPRPFWDSLLRLFDRPGPVIMDASRVVPQAERFDENPR